MSNQARLIFHRRTFFELVTAKRALFIDPVFSHERRGRRVADETRACDYVLATAMTPWFDDALDVLDGCDATFISNARLSRYVSDELELKQSRLLDLEPWERASEEGLGITALPITGSIGMETAINEGASFVRDVGNIMPKRARKLPLIGGALPMLDSTVRSAASMVGNLTAMGQPRSLDRASELLGMDVGQLTGGRPGLGYLFELDGGPTVVHMADGVHEGTSDEDLEDIADVCQPDVLVLHAAGWAVEPIVRAARILKPKTALLYRSRDPYRSGRRGQTMPISSFIGAIEEGAPATMALHLRKGDEYLLDKAKTTLKPSAGDGKTTSPGLGAKKIGVPSATAKS